MNNIKKIDSSKQLCDVAGKLLTAVLLKEKILSGDYAPSGELFSVIGINSIINILDKKIDDLIRFVSETHNNFILSSNE